jgi:hypothetical protein
MIIDELFEAPQQCPECGGISFSDLILAEKKDACYYKVKASAKVWPSAYASGRLVQCRKKGAANYGNKSEGVAEAPLPGQRRGPLDLQPLEGPGGGGGGSTRSGPSPFTPVKIPGTNINIPGVTQSTSPPPTVTKVPNINKKIDPASDVPAYVRKGLPDPVTVPKPGTKLKIQLKPGETMDQAVQRTRAEQEFGNFLKGQGGQSFGTPTTAQTSGSNQIPTLTLPNGQKIPDPYRLSPSGQYNTQSGSRKSIDQIERDDKRAVDAMVNRTRQSTIDREAREKKQSDLIQPVQPKWKNRDTDIELEEARKKREQPEAKYDDEYDAMVARVKRLAGLGPMKTVYNPNKRVYRNMPTAVQPKK